MKNSKFAIFVSLLLFVILFISVTEFMRFKSNANLFKDFLTSKSINYDQKDLIGLENRLIIESSRYKRIINYPIPKFVANKLLGNRKLDEITYSLDAINSTLPTLRDLLGFNGNRRYLLAFQNPAEARGSGGIIGGYAVINLLNGRFKVEKVGANTDLQSMKKLPISMPSDFRRIYGDDPAIWQNSNYSPDFPSGAKIWLALWKNQFNENLDGVISIDPFVLKEVLAITGSVKLSNGSEINENNVIYELLSGLYFKYDNNVVDRKRVLVEIVRKTLITLQANNLNYPKLGWHLLNPIRQDRLKIYSNKPEIEKYLIKSSIGGSLNWNDGNQIKLVVQNTSGNKMDYYLERKLTVERLQCGKNPRVRAKVTLLNSVSPGAKLPDYVKGRLDLNKPEGLNNSHGVTVFLYGPRGEKYLLSQTSSSYKFLVRIGHELGRPLVVTKLDLEPGVPNSFFVDFSAKSDAIRTSVQPLVNDQSTRIFNSCPS